VTAVFTARVDYDHEHDHEMKTVSLPGSGSVSLLGQGTWRMGEDKRAHKDEVAALRLGIELGMTSIDTAEMYGDGGAEKIVADAVEDQRDRVFVVTKVYPHNASSTELPKACERSLKRLRIDAIALPLTLAGKKHTARGNGRGIRETSGSWKDQTLGRFKFRCR
jgi:diketogulonate reductase-like aldo/keto reductase